MKISNDTIGNRILDLPPCSTVPQGTAPPRAPNITCVWSYFDSYKLSKQTKIKFKKLKIILS